MLENESSKSNFLWDKKKGKAFSFSPDVAITTYEYSEGFFKEQKLTPEEIFQFEEQEGMVTWHNVNSIKDVRLIQQLSKAYNIHSLNVEDIVNVDQRPRVEEHDDYIFTVVKMITYDKRARRMTFEQISFILMDNMVISFQEREGDIFNGIRNRIRQDKGRIRKLGADYLYYLLMDVIVDHYIYVLHRLSYRFNKLEDQAILGEKSINLESIHSLKKSIALLKKHVTPITEILRDVMKMDSDIFHDGLQPYFKDIYDDSHQVVDNISLVNDSVNSLLNIYLSINSLKMNEVMKTLTVITTIFMPMTFIAGVYGMNFKYMPELNSEYGYYIVLGSMSLVGLLMGIYIRKKKWV